MFNLVINCGVRSNRKATRAFGRIPEVERQVACNPREIQYIAKSFVDAFTFDGVVSKAILENEAVIAISARDGLGSPEG